VNISKQYYQIWYNFFLCAAIALTLEPEPFLLSTQKVNKRTKTTATVMAIAIATN